jgi:hypothetical protein
MLTFDVCRMNVAITRAKELLVVVGNGELLQRDPYWKSFLQFALRNKLWVFSIYFYSDINRYPQRYVGPKIELESDGNANYISRLE